MSSDNRISRSDSHEITARRDFLSQIGKATVTAPAIALLLAASSKPSLAQSPYSPPDGDDCVPHLGHGHDRGQKCS
jgi:hypothetical protein